LERVKSFAPKVDHVVADIFVGPPQSKSNETTTANNEFEVEVGIIQYLVCAKEVDNECDASELDNRHQIGSTPPPSCALELEGGVLCREGMEWMEKKG
jgi:hypothetical protein